MAKFFGIGILSIILLSNAIPLLSQTQSTQKPLQARIQELEKENQTLKNRVDVLEGQKSNIDDRAALYKENIEKKWDILLWFLGFIGAGSFATWVLLIIRVKNIAEKKINEKFDRFFDQKKETIKEMIDFQNEELQIKKTKKILVLTPSTEDTSFIGQFFNGNGFNCDRKSADQDDIDFGSYDMVFFNDETEKFDHDFISELVKQFKKGAIGFYFGPGRVKPEMLGKIACANLRTQLYGNVMNALRYQDLIH